MWHKLGENICQNSKCFPQRRQVVNIHIYVYRYKHAHIGIQIIIMYDLNVLPLFSNNVNISPITSCLWVSLFILFFSLHIPFIHILIHPTHIFCLLGPCILWCSNIYGLILPLHLYRLLSDQSVEWAFKPSVRSPPASAPNTAVTFGFTQSKRFYMNLSPWH